jgi:hypothetical protein
MAWLDLKWIDFILFSESLEEIVLQYRKLKGELNRKVIFCEDFRKKTSARLQRMKSCRC